MSLFALSAITAAIRKVNQYTPGDPHWSSVVLLMHFDNLADSSESGKTPIVYGSASVIDSAEAFGGKELNIPDSSSYIRFDDSPDWHFGSGDFTVEFWFTPTQLPSKYHGLIGQAYRTTAMNSWKIITLNSATNGGVTIVAQVSTTGSSNTNNITSPFPLTLGQRHHVALVRHGATLEFFVDGISGGTSNLGAQALSNSSHYLEVGRWGNETLMGGRFDELRITKGVARYTENYTPPSGPFPSQGSGTS